MWDLVGNPEDRFSHDEAHIVPSLYFLNLKFHATSHLLCLNSLVCIRPGGKTLRQVSSKRGSYIRGVAIETVQVGI